MELAMLNAEVHKIKENQIAINSNNSNNNIN
jgi:hypothetical protein